MNMDVNASTGLGGNQTDTGQHGMPHTNYYEIHRIAAPELLVIDRIITPIFYLIGIVGNPLSASIWLSAKLRKSNSSAIYLGYIAVVDMLFLFLHVWMELLQAWGVKTFNRPVWCEIFMVLQMTPQYLAPLLILGFTFERFIAICFPFLKESFCTVKRAFICVNILTSLALAFGLLQAYFWTYSDISGVCDIRPISENFYRYWTWISEMLVFLVVPLTVLIFNILVIAEIRKINQFTTSFGQDCGRGSNQTSTITLLSVSFYLICTLLPATIVYAIQLSIQPGNLETLPADWSKDATWSSYLTYYHIRRIVEEICLSNYACYVFIYYITSAYFREEVHRIWCFKYLQCFHQKSLSDEKKAHNMSASVTIVNSKGHTVVVDNDGLV